MILTPIFIVKFAAIFCLFISIAHSENIAMCADDSCRDVLYKTVNSRVTPSVDTRTDSFLTLPVPGIAVDVVGILENSNLVLAMAEGKRGLLEKSTLDNTNHSGDISSATVRVDLGELGRRRTQESEKIAPSGPSSHQDASMGETSPPDSEVESGGDVHRRETNTANQQFTSDQIHDDVTENSASESTMNYEKSVVNISHESATDHEARSDYVGPQSFASQDEQAGHSANKSTTSLGTNPAPQSNLSHEENNEQIQNKFTEEQEQKISRGEAGFGQPDRQHAQDEHQEIKEPGYKQQLPEQGQRQEHPLESQQLPHQHGGKVYVQEQQQPDPQGYQHPQQEELHHQSIPKEGQQKYGPGQQQPDPQGYQHPQQEELHHQPSPKEGQQKYGPGRQQPNPQGYLRQSIHQKYRQKLRDHLNQRERQKYGEERPEPRLQPQSPHHTSAKSAANSHENVLAYGTRQMDEQSGTVALNTTDLPADQKNEVTAEIDESTTKTVQKETSSLVNATGHDTLVSSTPTGADNSDQAESGSDHLPVTNSTTSDPDDVINRSNTSVLSADNKTAASDGEHVQNVAVEKEEAKVGDTPEALSDDSLQHIPSTNSDSISSQSDSSVDSDYIGNTDSSLISDASLASEASVGSSSSAKSGSSLGSETPVDSSSFVDRVSTNDLQSSGTADVSDAASLPDISSNADVPDVVSLPDISPNAKVPASASSPDPSSNTDQTDWWTSVASLIPGAGVDRLSGADGGDDGGADPTVNDKRDGGSLPELGDMETDSNVVHSTINQTVPEWLHLLLDSAGISGLSAEHSRLSILLFSVGFTLVVLISCLRLTERLSQENCLKRVISNQQRQISSLRQQVKQLIRDSENSSSKQVCDGRLEEMNEALASALADKQSIEQQLTESCSNVTSLTSKVTAQQAELAELQQLVEELQNMLQTAQSGADDTIVCTVNKLERELKQQRRKQLAVVEKLKLERKQLQEELSTDKLQLSSLKHQLEEVQESVENKDREHEDLTAQLQLSNDARSQSEQKYSELSEQQDQLKTQIVELQKQCETAQTCRSDAEDRADSLAAEVTSLTDLVKQLKNSDNTDDAGCDQLLDAVKLKSQVDKLSRDRSKMKKEWRQDRNQLQTLREAETDMKSQLEASNTRCEQAEVAKYEAESKLDHLEKYFQKKELAFHEEVGELKHRLSLSCGGVSETQQRLQQLDNEATQHKQLIESLKQEIQDQERSFRGQVQTLEKRVHESWVARRQAERRYEEANREAAQIRAMLLQRETVNGSALNGAGSVHSLAVNGCMSGDSPVLELEALSPTGADPPLLAPPPPLAPFLPAPPPMSLSIDESEDDAAALFLSAPPLPLSRHERHYSPPTRHFRSPTADSECSSHSRRHRHQRSPRSGRQHRSLDYGSSDYGDGDEGGRCSPPVGRDRDVWSPPRRIYHGSVEQGGHDQLYRPRPVTGPKTSSPLVLDDRYQH